CAQPAAIVGACAAVEFLKGLLYHQHRGPRRIHHVLTVQGDGDMARPVEEIPPPSRNIGGQPFANGGAVLLLIAVRWTGEAGDSESQLDKSRTREPEEAATAP